MVKEYEFLSEFELPSGQKHCMIIKAPNIQDAQIESSNIADDQGWEHLAIDIIDS